MPRPKYGLGHGLDALVTSSERPTGWPESEPTDRGAAAKPTRATTFFATWEYAALARSRRRKKGRSRLSLRISHPGSSVRPRKQKIRGVSQWTALGILGADGWELVAVRQRSFLLKRIVDR